MARLRVLYGEELEAQKKKHAEIMKARAKKRRIQREKLIKEGKIKRKVNPRRKHDHTKHAKIVSTNSKKTPLTNILRTSDTYPSDELDVYDREMLKQSQQITTGQGRKRSQEWNDTIALNNKNKFLEDCRRNRQFFDDDSHH